MEAQRPALNGEPHRLRPLHTRLPTPKQGLAGWLSVPGIWPVPGSRFGTRPSEIARGADETRLPVTAADKECSLLDG